MIKLKSLLLETISQEISSLERQLTSKYKQYIEDLYFYYDDKNNSIFISDIYMKQQFKGRGWGTKIMNDICQFADNKKMAIALIPATDSINPSGLRRLVRFYKRFGFIENSGNSTFDDMSMYRLPK
jgi:GNAT superfamily N-acetyltransferase